MEGEKVLLVARAAIWQDRMKEKILLGQRPVDANNFPDRWEFPGGKYFPSEKTVIALRREVEEETGLTIARYYPAAGLENRLVMDNAQSHFFGWLVCNHVFEALACGGKLLEDPLEHQQLRWVTLEEAQTLPLTNQTDYALPYLRQRQNEQRVKRGLPPLPELR